MKKKVVTLLLSLTLVLGVMGCGGAEATNTDVPQKQAQEVQQTQGQEIKQEAQAEEKKEYVEYEYFFALDAPDLKQLSTTAYNNETMSPNGEYCGEFKLKDTVNLYTTYQNQSYYRGYTKPNIPITCFNSDNDWIRLRFYAEDGTPNDNYLITVEDFLENFESLEAIGGVVPKRVGDSKKLQNFVDDDNYCTFEEYWTQVNEIITEREKEHIEAIQDYKKEHPDFDFDETAMHPVEVFENKDEFEKIGTYAPFLTKENCKGAISDTAEIIWRLEEYYIEVTIVQNEYVEWDLYGKMKEEYK